MGKIFVIMSGKGGVGKSTISAALAEYYAGLGLQVALLDGDVGLRCADLMLNMQDRVVYDLGDVTDDRCGLDRALIVHPRYPSLSLLAAPQMLKPSDVKAKKMKKIIESLAERMDIVLLDAPAGIGRGLKNLLGVQAETFVVATPDDVSIRDAERLSSLLFERGEIRPGLILNRVNEKLIRRGEMMPPHQISAVLDMPLMGILPESSEIYRALLRHETALHAADKKVKKAVEGIALRLLGEARPLESYASHGIRGLFHRGGGARI